MGGGNDEIVISFKNVSDRALELVLAGRYTGFIVTLWSDDGDVVEYADRGKRLTDPKSTFYRFVKSELAPGKSSEWVCRLSELYDLEPGKYKLRVERTGYTSYPNKAFTIVGPVAEIDVSSPIELRP